MIPAFSALNTASLLLRFGQYCSASLKGLPKNVSPSLNVTVWEHNTVPTEGLGVGVEAGTAVVSPAVPPLHAVRIRASADKASAARKHFSVLVLQTVDIKLI